MGAEVTKKMRLQRLFGYCLFSTMVAVLLMVARDVLGEITPAGGTPLWVPAIFLIFLLCLYIALFHLPHAFFCSLAGVCLIMAITLMQYADVLTYSFLGNLLMGVGVILVLGGALFSFFLSFFSNGRFITSLITGFILFALSSFIPVESQNILVVLLGGISIVLLLLIRTSDFLFIQPNEDISIRRLMRTDPKHCVRSAMSGFAFGFACICCIHLGLGIEIIFISILLGLVVFLFLRWKPFRQSRYAMRTYYVLFAVSIIPVLFGGNEIKLVSLIIFSAFAWVQCFSLFDVTFNYLELSDKMFRSQIFIFVSAVMVGGILVLYALTASDIAATSKTFTGMVLFMSGLVVLCEFVVLGPSSRTVMADYKKDIKQTITDHSVRESKSGANKRCSEIAKEYGLTDRQSEVMALLFRGRTAKFIGESLSISTNTAKVHIGHIYRKLGVGSQQELINIIEGKSNELR